MLRKKYAVLVLAGLATIAVFISLQVGDKPRDTVFFKDPFPPTLSERIYPFGVPKDIASRQVQMDKLGRYTEYYFDIFKNGDKGILRFHYRGTLAEITMEYAATGKRVWFRLDFDGVTILEKRTVDIKTGAIIDEGERLTDRTFVLREFFPGSESNAKQVKRSIVYDPRAMVLRSGLAGVNLIRKDTGFWPNQNLKYEFTAADPITSDLHTYTENGLPESYLNVNYRYRKGWFFHPDGKTKRMIFERLRFERNWTGFWEVHTDYFSPSGTLEAKRVFTRDAMFVHIDVPGFGQIEQLWSMKDNALPEDKRLLADNFSLAHVQLPNYRGKQNFRFVFKSDGSLKEVWFEDSLAGGNKVKVFLTLDASGKVVSQRVIDLAKDKPVDKPIYTGLAAFVVPPQLKVLTPYQPPPVAALDPDHFWGH